MLCVLAPGMGRAAAPDRWLHVQGRFLVDAEGQPYRLVGIGRYQPESGIDNKRVGNIDEICAHYKQRGMNAIRLAVGGKNDWLPDIEIRRWGGFDGYLRQVVDPEVQACKRNGMYVMLDLHVGAADEATAYEWFIPFWQAAARRYRDDPWVAVYELWNEPNLKPHELKPESAEPLRKWYAECIRAIRAIDPKHVILVSDWNAGWGSATESQWEPARFDPGDPAHQIAFSKHLAKEHCTPEFLDRWVDQVSKKWNVPLMVGEFELGDDIMDAAALGVFGRWLEASDGKYGWFTWSVGGGFEAQWQPVAERCASPVPGFPPVHAFRYEDFEVPTNLASWNVQTGGNVPAGMELSAPGVEGWGHALRVTFGPHRDQGKGNWAQVYSCWVMPERFGDVAPDRISFQLKGDGTPAEVYRQQVLLSGERFLAERHRATVPLDDKDWHPVVPTGSDFTPPVTDFRKIVRVTFGCVGANSLLEREVTFEVDNVEFQQALR
ncbi:MAG: cellulase family glycosylhydrolase [Armatimonadetes bacterium]|nr:cellulase family glycosylhydrolase [Armatimonadota bacterium]